MKSGINKTLPLVVMRKNNGRQVDYLRFFNFKRKELTAKIEHEPSRLLTGSSQQQVVESALKRPNPTSSQ